MKYLLPLMIAPAIAFAQPPDQGEMSKQDYFDGIKVRMVQMIEVTVPAMEKTQVCLEKAGDKQALNGCVEIMAAAQRELMGPKGAARGEQKVLPKPDIEWSDETRNKMLEDLVRAIKESKVAGSCFESSGTPDQMDACMEQSGLAK